MLDKPYSVTLPLRNPKLVNDDCLRESAFTWFTKGRGERKGEREGGMYRRKEEREDERKEGKEDERKEGREERKEGRRGVYAAR